MRRLLALAAFQVLAILGWASYHEYVWATAPTFRVPLRPRDPFDLIRGRYFVLNPQDTSIDARSISFSQQEVDRFLGSANAFAGSVQVGFCAAGDVYRVCALARPGETPSGPARFWCKGFVDSSSLTGFSCLGERTRRDGSSRSAIVQVVTAPSSSVLQGNTDRPEVSVAPDALHRPRRACCTSIGYYDKIDMCCCPIS